MSEHDEELLELCPECGDELWYDGAAGCWVCESCGEEFYEEDWEEWEDDEAEEDEGEDDQAG